MPERTPTGRYILVAFVAGMVAGGGLVGMPLYDAVQRVEDLEAQQGIDEASLHAQAGRSLRDAGVALIATDVGGLTEQLPAATRALRTAAGILSAAPPSWPAGPALSEATSVLSNLTRAAQAGLVTEDELGTERAETTSLPGLGTELVEMGNAVTNQSSPGRSLQGVEQRTEAIRGALAHALEMSGTIRSAERANGTVTVVLEGHAPTLPAPPGWTLEVCTQAETGAAHCASSTSSSVGLERLDARTVALDAPGDPTDPLHVELTVGMPGGSGDSSCTIPAGEAASCRP